MYRSTPAGLALEEALNALTTTPDTLPSGESDLTVLSSAQREIIWSCFEEAMTESLAEVPRNHVVAIEAPLLAEPNEEEVTDEENVSPQSVVSVPFPQYRLVDGRWTVLFKDATLKLSGQQALVLGTSEIKVDYLKLEAKQAQPSQAAQPKRASKRTRGKNQ